MQQEDYSVLPLAEELTPSPDPWELCQRLLPLPGHLFLDSAAGPAQLGRYSFVTAAPFRWLEARGRKVRVRGWSGNQFFSEQREADPFALLAEHLSQFSAATASGLPPFQGGAAVYYEITIDETLTETLGCRDRHVRRLRGKLSRAGEEIKAADERYREVSIRRGKTRGVHVLRMVRAAS